MCAIVSLSYLYPAGQIPSYLSPSYRCPGDRGNNFRGRRRRQLFRSSVIPVPRILRKTMMCAPLDWENVYPNTMIITNYGTWFYSSTNYRTSILLRLHNLGRAYANCADLWIYGVGHLVRKKHPLDWGKKNSVGNVVFKMCFLEEKNLKINILCHQSSIIQGKTYKRVFDKSGFLKIWKQQMDSSWIF